MVLDRDSCRDDAISRLGRGQEVYLVACEDDLDCHIHRFQDEVGWAFKIFDIDNSGSIAVQEIDDSVKVIIKKLIIVKIQC